MSARTLAILGGGQMGRALVGGLLRCGTRAEHLRVGESSPDACAQLMREFGISASSDNASVVAGAQVVVLAVKPQDAPAALTPLASLFARERPVVLSIAAGLRIAALAQWCGPDLSILRAMPNRPALVGAGITGLYAPPNVGDAARNAAAEVLRAVGDVVWVESEDDLDIVTALSGSGPAYFFLLAESMARAATHLGLAPQTARRLAVGTLYGAGLLAQSSDADLEELRAQVTSKGGTTAAAIGVLDAADLHGIVAGALAAATRRSRELGGAS